MGGFTVIIMQVSGQIGLNWNWPTGNELGKKHEAKFVNILAVCIIKRLLDSFISGQSWNNFFKKKGSMAFKKPKSCESCSKGFLNDMTLKRHIKR